MKFIRLRTVLEITALSSSSLYRLMEAGKFPKNVSLGDRAVAWVEEEIEDWVQHRIEDRDTETGKL